ncbi:MAG: M48 family metalloprotease [Isosphaerales bacterium]
MVRYMIAAVFSCLYVAGSILVVLREGQAYRDDLSKTKLAASVIEKSAVAFPGEMARTASAVTASETTSSRPEPAPATVAGSSAKPAAKPSPPAPPAIKLAKAKLATSPPAPRAPARPAGAVAAHANPLLNDPFWSQPPLTRAWDLTYLKAEDELRLGAELHDLIVQLNPLVEDGPWLSRVEDAAEPFLKTLIRKGINYKFFVLNSDAVNAFSTPGGYVYVSRGLFDLIGEDEDDALQFAIGHEIAHVDLQHAIRCLQDPGVKQMTEGTLQKLYLLIIPFGYLVSDKVDQEFDADLWVLNRMQRFGRTRRETLVFLQKLDGYAKKHGFDNGRAKPQPGRDISPLENHYRSQTAARKRLKHLKELMDQPAIAPK